MSLSAVVEAADPPITWLPPLVAFISLLLGSGGIVAWLRLRNDKTIGVAQNETASDIANDNRWKAIIEAQTKSLLEPLQSRLREVEDKVVALEKELEISRRKYWSLIAYARTLMTWVAGHLPDDIEHTQIPQPPANIAEDI